MLDKDDFDTWARERVQEHYDRVVAGDENKPMQGIVDMLWEAYGIGQERGANTVIGILREAIKNSIGALEAHNHQ